MTRSKDHSFNKKEALKLEMKLKDEIKKLKLDNLKLKQRIEELEKVKELNKDKKPTIKKECPKCGAIVTESKIPAGTIRLCSSACGFRELKK